MSPHPTHPSFATLGRAASLAASLLALVSCGAEPEVAPAFAPTVRTFEVGKEATGQSRRISGRVEALDRSSLSFGVSGKITEISVVEGQEVAQGQLLATLDSAMLGIAANEAASQMAQARASLTEAKTDFERTKTLAEKGGASQQELEVATAALATADGVVANAESAVARAQLDLGRAKLVAPFEGRIVTIEPDPFQEVGPSETIVVIQAQRALKVEVLVPESMIRSVDYGQAVQVQSPSVAEQDFSAVVTRIAADAGEGNAFPVTVELAGSPADLRPGMTASVTFNFDAYLEGKTAYLIPLSCIAVDVAAGSGGGDASAAPVFCFDSATETVQLRSIQVGNLRGNEVEVLGGLERGDLIVSAGVAFVRDGMPARVWVPRR